jgi:hypothetical protein
MLNAASSSDEAILDEIKRGARFVRYPYCISIIFMSFKRESGINLVSSRSDALLKSFPWIILTMLLGWWGVPWGPIWSIQCILKGLSGGRDVTDYYVDAIL